MGAALPRCSPGGGCPVDRCLAGAATVGGAAPTAGLGALLAPLVAQLFAPARGRAASLDGCALPPLRKLPITGGLGADRRFVSLGPPRGLGEASGALIRFYGDGFAGRLGVALVAPSAGKKALRETRSRQNTQWCCPDDARKPTAPWRAALLCAGVEPLPEARELLSTPWRSTSPTTSCATSRRSSG